MTGAADLVGMLRAHYAGTPSKPAAGYLAAEVQAPDSTRRADALWLPLDGYSRGKIIGHEIKVSRSDVMSELADPMKAEAWAKFCDAWWLVVPDVGILRNLDLPEHWGVMTPPNGKRSKRLMTIVNAAAPRRPQDQHMAYATVLARIFYNGDDQGTQLRSARDRLERAEQRLHAAENERRDAEARLRRAGLAQRSVSDRVEQHVREVLDGLAAAHITAGDDHDGWMTAMMLRDTSAADIVAALVDPARVRVAARELAHEVRQSLQFYRRALAEPDTKAAEAALARVLGDIEPIEGRTP